MPPDEARQYILSLYENLLGREPGSQELDNWVQGAVNGKSAESLYYAFVNSQEYRRRTRVFSQFPAGHYYSAVVDPATVGDYVARERGTGIAALAESGIAVPLDEMEAFWRRSSDVIRKTPFQETKNETRRYHYQGMFPYGDAIGLRAMIAELKPQRIIEIGSGFSSACMLDCADEFGLDMEFTFIDPYPERLKSLLRREDYQRVTIIEEPVQKTDLSLFRSVRRGDILFIDSTHVLKTGSDVHYELFHILPLIQQGVMVHFHDIQFPFEYPDPWIFKNNYSWNEIYALRSFLMYNTDFRIRFWGNCLAHERREAIAEVFPIFLKNPGGSLWIERTECTVKAISRVNGP